MVWAFGQDGSWTPSGENVPEMANKKETPGQTQEGLYLSAGQVNALRFPKMS